MKNFLVLALLTLTALFCFDGCSMNRQIGHSVTFDPKTGIVATNSLTMVTYTTGNAKTAIESQRGSVGKTISIGIKGLNEETDMAATIKAFGEVAKDLVEAGATVGAKVVVPKP